MARLTPHEIQQAAVAVPEWQLTGNAITRSFVFRDFVDAIRFVNRVAEPAEASRHHPDIDIRWNKVTLALSTHDAGGLTSKDFDLAQKLDKLVES